MVGDRGMISHQSIDQMRQIEGIGWITAEPVQNFVCEA
jgi:hypothetical protein